VTSLGNEDFWHLYHALPADARAKARQAYRLFLRDPDHPSLRFKKLKGTGDLWSIRFGSDYRAVCERFGDRVEWVWIGTRQSFGKDF